MSRRRQGWGQGPACCGWGPGCPGCLGWRQPSPRCAPPPTNTQPHPRPPSSHSRITPGARSTSKGKLSLITALTFWYPNFLKYTYGAYTNAMPAYAQPWVVQYIVQEWGKYLTFARVGEWNIVQIRMLYRRCVESVHSITLWILAWISLEQSTSFA